MKADVTVMVKRFLLHDVTPQSVARWMDELEAAGTSASSRARIASFCRSYWRYLQSPAVSAVPMVQPFTGLNIKKKKATREPFEPADVVKLWKAAHALEDETLADLIMIGAHTGARIEELCMLRLDDVTAKHSFKIAKSKTAAGVREVPIHSRIRPLVQRLKRASTDGYLIADLSRNKYEHRSNAVGKRFGRLKKAHGFGTEHVFHSLRGTLVTMLENAGVSENLAADIVGHEKPRITYGLYSGGPTLEVKALESVRYPPGTAKVT